MDIGRPYILNTSSFLILFRSALFKAMRLSAEGNPCSINGVSGTAFALITMKSGLVWILQETWSVTQTQNVNCVRSKTGKEENGGFGPCLLLSYNVICLTCRAFISTNSLVCTGVSCFSLI